MGKPQAISEAEAARILNSKEEAAARPKTEIRVDYEIGDQVKVLDGPYASFNGLVRSEEHTSELQSLMRISYAVLCLKKKKNSCTITSPNIPSYIRLYNTRPSQPSEISSNTHIHT